MPLNSNLPVVARVKYLPHSVRVEKGKRKMKKESLTRHNMCTIVYMFCRSLLNAKCTPDVWNTSSSNQMDSMEHNQIEKGISQAFSVFCCFSLFFSRSLCEEGNSLCLSPLTLPGGVSLALSSSSPYPFRLFSIAFSVYWMTHVHSSSNWFQFHSIVDLFSPFLACFRNYIDKLFIRYTIQAN